ncbi:MAG: hypothetical protein HY268_16330 [Deltaproteobacteria bacterium]|nr:hypothetical protein [Deltaproteobacteria bacterium]
MAKKTQTPSPRLADLTPAEMKAALPKLLRRVEELKSVDISQVQKRGDLTLNALEHKMECIAKAKMCIADLSFNNPNAFYELGVRHICKLPTVQIIRKGDKIPFDVSQGWTIKIDMSDVYSVIESIESAEKELRQQVRHALSNEYKGEDNPVNTYLSRVEVRLPRQVRA